MKKYYLVLPAAMVCTAFALPFSGHAAMGSAAGLSAVSGKTVSVWQDSVIRVASSEEVQKGAENFIDNMTQRGISFLADESLSHEQRKKEFEKLLNDSFDTKTIARFALGRYWRQANSEERAEYLKLFNTMIIDVYSNRFKEYQGQTLKVKGVRAEGKKDALVTSMIIDKNNPNVQVDWRVRYKDGKYKVIDVIVEGVSMSLTQRSDFASVIQRGGGKISVLLDHMRK